MNNKILSFIIIVLTIDSARAQDWANIHRYEKANSEVLPPTEGEKRVVYMGDSITDSWIRIARLVQKWRYTEHCFKIGIGKQIDLHWQLKTYRSIIKMTDEHQIKA